MDTYHKFLALLQDAAKAAGGKPALMEMLDTSKPTFYKALAETGGTLPATRVLCRWLDALNVNVSLSAGADYAALVVSVPRIPAEALPRPGDAKESGRTAVSRAWLRQRGVNAADCLAVYGLELGDTVQPRDDVLIDTAQRTLKDGRIYAVAVAAGESLLPPALKRVQRVPNGWQLSGESPSSPPFMAGDADLKIYGRAVRLCRNL